MKFLGRMASVSLVVIVESVHSVVDHKSGDLNDFHIPSLVAVGAALGTYIRMNSLKTPIIYTALGVKFILFLYCFSLRKQSSQVHVLWEDHRNDLFVNGFGKLPSLKFCR